MNNKCQQSTQGFHAAIFNWQGQTKTLSIWLGGFVGTKKKVTSIPMEQKIKTGHCLWWCRPERLTFTPGLHLASLF